jgi:hypothetical protein
MAKPDQPGSGNGDADAHAQVSNMASRRSAAL